MNDSDMVHFEPIVYVVRFYEPGKSFQNRDPYCATMTVQVMDDVAFIQGLHGDLERRHYKVMLKKIKERHINFINAERHGKPKVYDVETYCKIIERGSMFQKE